MAINRVDNQKLTPLNPRERHFVSEDPCRAPGASGMDVARCGSQTLDRAHQNEYSASRRHGLTPPAPRTDSSEYGDASYGDPILY